MKNVLITGARRGLGKALATHLDKNNYNIYATSREGCGLISLDLTNKQSIENCANYFIRSQITLDAIIHNAGIAYSDVADVLVEDERRHMFDVNFFGPIYLTQLLLPMLRNQRGCSLIFISSIVSQAPWPGLGVYAASKAALEAVAYEWHELLAKWNIKVSIVQPGPLKTNMQIMRSKNQKHSPYANLIQPDLDWQSIDKVCETVCSILEDNEPGFRYQP